MRCSVNNSSFSINMSNTPIGISLAFPPCFMPGSGNKPFTWFNQVLCYTGIQNCFDLIVDRIQNAIKANLKSIQKRSIRGPGLTHL